MSARAALLNHLLAQSNGLLPRLSRFAGMTARFDIAPFSCAYTILSDGSLRSVDSDTTADAVCVIALSLLPRLALNDETAYQEIVTFGDAALLSEIFFLSRNLRWDAGKDLSRLTGEDIAERILRTVRDKREQLHDIASNFSKAAAGYCTLEHPLLVRQPQLTQFAQQVEILRNDISRLEQRIKLYATQDL